MLPRWHVLNIGSITRNKFWGERDTESYRNAYCTCTVVRTDHDIILVDPSMRGEEMAYILDSRTGLAFQDITKVFVTHSHGDHLLGIDMFPDAQWFMMPKELDDFAAAESTAVRAKRFTPAGAEISPGIKTIEIPGHTPGLGGIFFTAAEGVVMIVGDGVMTRDFFRHRMGYHNSKDFDTVSASIEKISQIADVIVPGHDNAFRVAAAERDPIQEIKYTK